MFHCLALFFPAQISFEVVQKVSVESTVQCYQFSCMCVVTQVRLQTEPGNWWEGWGEKLGGREVGCVSLHHFWGKPVSNEG